jgi:hypothetical protein
MKTIKFLIAFALLIFSQLALSEIRVPAGQNIQTYLNMASGQKLIISGGSYTTTGLTCINDVEIVSDGKVTISSTAASPIISLSGCSDVSINGDFEIVGNGANYTGHPGSSMVDGAQVGIYLNNSTNIDIDGNIEIRNIKGSGIKVENTTLTGTVLWRPNIKIRGVYAHDSYRGIYTLNKGEYLTFSDVTTSYNLYGIFIDSGNVSLVNAKSTYNSVGITLWSGVNHAHGVVGSSIFNHNYYNLSMNGLTAGMAFSGCNFIGEQNGSGAGRIQVVNSKGVNLVGGMIGSNITVDSTSTISVQGNYIYTALSSITGAGTWVAKNNITELGVLWAGNN